jgi:hypothetical protein
MGVVARGEPSAVGASEPALGAYSCALWEARPDSLDAQPGGESAGDSKQEALPFASQRVRMRQSATLCAERKRGLVLAPIDLLRHLECDRVYGKSTFLYRKWIEYAHPTP